MYLQRRKNFQLSLFLRNWKIEADVGNLTSWKNVFFFFLPLGYNFKLTQRSGRSDNHEELVLVPQGWFWSVRSWVSWWWFPSRLWLKLKPKLRPKTASLHDPPPPPQEPPSEWQRHRWASAMAWTWSFSATASLTCFSSWECKVDV